MIFRSIARSLRAVKARSLGASFALVLLGGALTGGSAQAETPPAPEYIPVTVHSPKGQENGRWAERTRVAGDLNKDGVDDLWVGVPGYRRNGKPYGRVYAVDGASLASPQGQRLYPKILYKIHPPEPQEGAQFGFFIENPGDLNDDGYPEVVVGTDAQDVPIDPDDNSQICEPHPERCKQHEGKAWVFDGKNNKVLYDLTSPHREGTRGNRARLGSRLGRAGDVTGDGVSEIIAGASDMDDPPGCADAGFPPPPHCRRNEGRAFIFDGTNGELVRELQAPEEDTPDRPCIQGCGGFGLAVQGPGDVDGDGVPDQSVGAALLSPPGGFHQQGRMYVYSGASGRKIDNEPIRRIDDPQPHPFSLFGFQDVTPLDPGDVNNDGRADVYAMGFNQQGEGGPAQGKAWVFNGGAGNSVRTPELYEVGNPRREACLQFGWSMTRERNRTRPGDPADDADPLTNPLYVGSSPHHCRGDQRGETNTFNSLTGTWLQRLELPPPWNTELEGPGPRLGWTVSSPGDLNGDGFREFIAGAPFTDVCHIRTGSQNKDIHPNQGVMIVFKSSPAGEPQPPPNDQNPADNVCTEDQQGG